MRLCTAAILCALFGALGACAVDECADLGAASIEIGSGPEDAFVELAGGEDLALALGPRGLWMITPGLRLDGLLSPWARRVTPVDRDISRWVEGSEAQRGRLVVTATRGGEVIGGGRENDTWDDFYEGYYVEFEGALQDLDGLVVTLRAEVEDACGHTASDEVSVRLVQ